jgi:hypothetical protein
MPKRGERQMKSALFSVAIALVLIASTSAFADGSKVKYIADSIAMASAQFEKAHPEQADLVTQIKATPSGADVLVKIYLPNSEIAQFDCMIMGGGLMCDAN